jgi:hypothetical protein
MRRLGIHLVVLATCLGATLPVSAFGDGAGKAISLNGEVFLTAKGAPERRPLNPGDALSTGDVVETLQASSARLLLPDQSVLDLGPSTQFRVEAFDSPGGDPGSGDRAVETSLELGRIRASVNRKLDKKGKFLLKTRSSIMAVRGTEFVAEASPGKTLVTVSDGTVEVATPPGAPRPASVLVPKGGQISAVAELSEGSKVARASLSRIASLGFAQLSAILGRSRVEDHTFTQGVVVGDIRSRFRGASTLGLARTVLAIPKLSLPRASFAIPGTFTPNAQLVGVQQNVASETVTVTFK